MKNKLIAVGFAIATLGIAGVAQAQSAHEIDKKVAFMRGYLHLTGQQAGAIRADYFAASDEKKAIKRNPNLAPMQKRFRIEEVDRSTAGQVRAILSPEQLRQWRHFKEGF